MINKNLNLTSNIASTSSHDMTNRYFNSYGIQPNLVNYSCTINIDEIANYLIDKGFTKTQHTYYESLKDKNPFTVCLFVSDTERLHIIADTEGFYILYPTRMPTDYIKEFSKSKYQKVIKTSKELCIIIPDQDGGYRTVFKKLKRTDFKPENYNEDFAPTHKLIVEAISEENRSGLYLFHGDPGTGKSSYIASLTQMKTNKKFIYLPSSLFNSLDSPSLMKLFLDNRNSIFIIEDGEKLLINRENESDSPISSLLNMSDGLIGQLLNSQIICTFNTNLSKVDKALMRKGRLICSYEFKPLSKERAINLAKQINKPFEHINGPMTLSEVYNYDDESYEIKTTRQIGFKQ